MYTKVILPLDGSEEAEKAIPEALRVLSYGQGPRELHILRVLEFGTGWSSTAVIRALEDEKKVAATYLASLSLGQTPPELQVSTEVIPGSSPAQVIADHAANIGADLIVMTCQGRSGFSQFMVGSQTERTLRLANCSILIVR